MTVVVDSSILASWGKAAHERRHVFGHRDAAHMMGLQEKSLTRRRKKAPPKTSSFSGRRKRPCSRRRPKMGAIEKAIDSGRFNYPCEYCPLLLECLLKTPKKKKKSSGFTKYLLTKYSSGTSPTVELLSYLFCDSAR
jgi:hypothetical protein